MIDLSTAFTIVIPEGEVARIARGDEILWERFSLPDGYSEVEYIEGDGTQYIDTGFIPDNNTRVWLDADVPKDASGATYVMGTHEWTSGKYYIIRITTTSNVYMSDYGKHNASTGVKPAGRMIFDKNKNVCTIGGKVTTNTEYTFTCASTLMLLAASNTSDVVLATPGKIYGCKVWDNDVLIRNYIPCTNADGASGLYDLVGDAFYPFLVIS